MAIKKFHTKTHDEWLALRHQYIGGSDAASVVGMNPFRSAYTLWAEKTDREPGFTGNLTTRVGSYLEEFVAKEFEEASGRKVRRCNLSLVNDLYPWAVANVDRLIVGEDAGLEIKTTSELSAIGKFKGTDFPVLYYCQCVHYMAVTGRARWYLAVLIGNRELKIFCIERDQEEIDALMAAEQRFWQYVKTDTPPPVDGLESTTKSLSLMYDTEDGTTCDLIPVMQYIRLHSELKNQEKDLKKRIDDAANHIKAAMGNSSRGTAGPFTVTWKNQERRSLDQKALHRQWPEVDLEEFMTTTSSRVLRIKS